MSEGVWFWFFRGGNSEGAGARPRRRRRGFPRSVRTHRPTSSAMSQPMNRWNMPIARLQEMRGISEGPVSSSSSRAPCKSSAEEDLVSAEVLSAAMVASVEGRERTRTRGIGAREREARGERRRRGQESRTSRGAGWGHRRRGVRVSSPAFSRGTVARWTRAATTTTARAFARVELTPGGTPRDVTRQRDGHGQCRRAPRSRSDPGFASYSYGGQRTNCFAAEMATRAGLRAFPLRVRPPLTPFAAQHAARWRSYAR